MSTNIIDSGGMWQGQCMQAVEREGHLSSGIWAPLSVHVWLWISFSGSHENTTLAKVNG